MYVSDRSIRVSVYCSVNKAWEFKTDFVGKHNRF